MAGRLHGIGAVHRVLANVRAVEFADRAFGSLGWVGGADDVPVLRYRVFTLECDDDNRTARHELDQLPKKRAGAMHVVEAFGLLLREVKLTQRLDGEAFLLETRNDSAGMTGFGCIGFDNREGALKCHGAPCTETIARAQVIGSPGEERMTMMTPRLTTLVQGGG